MNVVSMAPEPMTPVESQIMLSATEYQDLQESRRMFATLLSNMPGMAYRFSSQPGWQFEYVSAGCYDLIGYTADELLSGRITWAELLSAEDLRRTQQLTRQAVSQRCPYGFTFQIRTASGAPRWVWEQGQAVFNPDGTIQAYEGFVTDVTERVTAHELLEARVAERTRELETMLEVSRSVASTLEIEPLFATIIDQIQCVIDCNAVSIGVIEDDVLVVVASWRDETGILSRSAIGVRFPVSFMEPFVTQPVYSPDVRGDDWVAVGFRERVGDMLDTVYAHVTSWIAAPLISRDKLIGVFFVSSVHPDHYRPHDLDLAMATANQIAVAIENAQLHEQARKLAAIEERQRLARELHDSVSQALFGIGLGTETALTALERNPDSPAQVADALRYVRELANIGQAEMRALIFELRPESLEQEGLVRAIEKQATALGARNRIAIETTLCAEPDAPFPVKEALYRIAQEAMHNAIKHARPRTLKLCLETSDALVILDVTDDGVGFDTSASFPGHLGLHSMPERARQLGGDVTVTSTLGTGTRVRASIPIV